MDYRTAKGWLTINERELLYRLAGEVPTNGLILGVGVEYGASCVCLYMGSRAANAHVYAVDIDLSKCVAPVESYSVGFQMDSARLAAEWSQGATLYPLYPGHEGAYPPINLAFIDGDHGYNAVAADCRFADYIPIGGVIAFHDCYSLELGKPHLHPHSPDCNIAVSDWYAEQAGKWEEQESMDSIRWFRRVT